MWRAPQTASQRAERKERPLDPGTDVTSSLLATRVDGEPLPDEMIVGTIRQVLVVGIIAPTVLIGSVAVHLSRDQALQAELRADPALAPAAMDEFLRLYTPYRGFARTPTRDVTLHGRTIPAGEPVALVYASANRDEDVFEDGGTFRLHRPNMKDSLHFGRGTQPLDRGSCARGELCLTVAREVTTYRARPLSQEFVMATKIAINGFGRIGRCIVRALVERGVKDIELVAINDLTDPKTLAHLFQYDSIHREFKAAKVGSGDKHITIGDQKIEVLALKDPAELPWKSLGVDIVLECTGLFTDKAKAAGHINAGAKRVIISAPAKGHDLTVVVGVNDQNYDASKHTIISCGSCTTNCLAPIAKVMLDNFGIVRGLMTTVHSYTNDQNLLDIPHRKGDLRRARAAAVNMIPSSTGAAKALSEVIPELKGKFDGLAIRVPTVDVSLVDLTLETEKPITKESIHAAMKQAADQGPMKDILNYTERELVSGDFIGSPASSTFDATMTSVLGDRFAKIFSWYDNEWGFSNRMIDLAQLVAKKGV